MPSTFISIQVYVKTGNKMGLPAWSRFGSLGNKWYQAQVGVNLNESYKVGERISSNRFTLF